MRLFKLGLVGLLAGAATIGFTTPALAGGASAAGSRASSGGVAVAGGGHLHNSQLVGRPKHRTPPRPWWDGHGGPANSGIWFGSSRPGGGSGHFGFWSPSDGHGGWSGHHGPDDGHDGPGNHHGHGHDHHPDFEDDIFYGGYWGYDEDGDAYVDTIPLPDQFGFFATGGQVVQRDGKQPIYAYDRGYPYEWYGGRSQGASPPPGMAPITPGGPPGPSGAAMSSGIRCEVQSTYDEANSRQAEVRVCRGW